MVFSSIVFLLYYLPISLVITICMKSLSFKGHIAENISLLFLSLLFYAWGEPLYVILMILSIVVNYELGISIDMRNKEKSLILGIIFNLSILFIFKYLSMFINFINFLIPYKDDLLTVPTIRLPIGISFFTFQALSYLVDVYRKDVPAQKNIINLGLYISFFPQLIAGPIVRYHDINKQLDLRDINVVNIHVGIKRFLIGLAKKVIIANNLGQVADTIFNLNNNDLSLPLAWLGILTYTLQIYFDFSGYSDMAIGLGKIFGFNFLENFNYPYIANSIQDFWRRWHISLSSWFRDYLYIPCGGNRKGNIRTYVNQFLVFFLCGLWHGASWNFVLWGIFHGVLLTLEKLLNKYILKIPNVIKHIMTLFLIMMSWVLFRIETFTDAISFYRILFGMNKVENVLVWKFLNDSEFVIILLLAIIFSTPLFKIIPIYLRRYANFIDLKVHRNVVKIIALVLIIISTGLISFPWSTNNFSEDELIIQVKSNSNKNQIFYKTVDSKYNESQSIKFEGNIASIPMIEMLDTVRFDSYLNNGELWEIEEIYITYKNMFLSLKGESLIKTISNTSSHIGNVELLENNIVALPILGHDPYFTLNLGYSLANFKEYNSNNRIKSFIPLWIISNFIYILTLLSLYYITRKFFNVNYKSNVFFRINDVVFSSVHYFSYMSLLIIIISKLASSSYNPFIYFRF